MNNSGPSTDPCGTEQTKNNADIFSRSEYDVGCANNFTARIETGNHAPIAEPLRRHERVHLDVIDETIENMKQAGIDYSVSKTVAVPGLLTW